MSATGDIMEADSERILELEIENGSLKERIAELEARCGDLVAEEIITEILKDERIAELIARIDDAIDDLNYRRESDLSEHPEALSGVRDTLLACKAALSSQLAAGVCDANNSRLTNERIV